MLAGAYPIGVLIGGVPSGIATTRYGARTVTIAGALVTGAATFVFATADSIAVLDAARFVQGIGSAFTWTGGLTWLVGETPAARRGQTIGTALAFAIVGALFGPVLGGVASVVGQGLAFGAAALLTVALAVWAFRTSAPPPVRAPAARLLAAGAAQPPDPARCLVRRPARALLRDAERARTAAPGRARLLGTRDRRALALHGRPRGNREPARRANHGSRGPHRADDRARTRIGGRGGRPALAGTGSGARGARRGRQHDLRQLLDARDGAALGRGRGARARVRIRLRADQHRLGSGAGNRRCRRRRARRSSPRTRFPT